MRGVTAMMQLDDTRTCRTLLGRVSDWRDVAAWDEFKGTYDPMLRRWCRRRGLDDHATDEVCQRIWIELADRMKTFQYDPNRSFRGWLRRLCESRIIDFVRQRKARSVYRIDGHDEDRERRADDRAREPAGTDHGDRDADLVRLSLLDEAAKVQALVRAKVKPHTWDAFWLVVVCDWTVEMTAKSLGMTHTAVYGARERVARMLCDQGKRLLKC